MLFNQEVFCLHALFFVDAVELNDPAAAVLKVMAMHFAMFAVELLSALETVRHYARADPDLLAVDTIDIGVFQHGQQDKVWHLEASSGFVFDFVYSVWVYPPVDMVEQHPRVMKKTSSNVRLLPGVEQGFDGVGPPVVGAFARP